MYTTKEIQNMMQFDTIVSKAKEFTEQTIALNANLTSQGIAYFNKVTDGKFTTYTDSFRKGVDTFAEQATEFVQTGKFPQVYGYSSKD